MPTIEYLRQFKISGYAIFDFVVSFIGIYLLSPLLSKLFLKVNLVIPTSSWMFFVLPSSILIHIMVGSITPMTRDFLDPSGHYFLKILIIVLFILGIKGIKLRSSLG